MSSFEIDITKLLLGNDNEYKYFLGVALTFFLTSVAIFAAPVYSEDVSTVGLIFVFLFVVYSSFLTAVFSSHRGGGFLTSLVLVAAPLLGAYVVLYIYLNYGDLPPQPIAFPLAGRFMGGGNYRNLSLNLHLTETLVLGTASYLLGKGLARLSSNRLKRVFNGTKN